MERNIESDVIGYIMERYPVRKRWYKPELVQITKEWTLIDDFRFIPEDAYDFLKDMFEHFNIDSSEFDWTHYIEREYPFWQKRPSPEPEIKPLTVAMIIESAKAHKWLYD